MRTKPLLILLGLLFLFLEISGIIYSEDAFQYLHDEKAKAQLLENIEEPSFKDVCCGTPDIDPSIQLKSGGTYDCSSGVCIYTPLEKPWKLYKN